MKTTILFLLLTLEATASVKIQKPRSTGKDYYIVFPKAAYSNPNVGVLLNSPTAQTVTITDAAQTKHSVKIATPRTSQYVGGLFQIVNTPEVVLKSAATRIQSTDQMGVVAQYGLGGISGTYTPIPVSAWGREYYAVAPPEGVNSAYTGYPAIYSVPMITIVSARAGTTVTITPKAKTALGHPADTAFTITLNAGDVYNITTQGDPQATNPTFDPCYANLSGTHILSNWPVGVIVSQSNTGWMCDSSHCGDYCVEWLPPVCNWDSVYVIAPAVSAARLNAEGEQIEFLFAYDNTELTADDGNSASRVLGTFKAGDMMDWPQPLNSTGLVLRASHPFLVAEYTRNATVCGTEPWTMSMNILTGVNQWSDFTAYSSATGSLAGQSLYFRLSDAPKLKLNGIPLLQLFPAVVHLPEGYAALPWGGVESDKYYELTGDSGASAGGTIFGYGTKTPGKAQSFAHPISANCTPKCNPDVTPPHDTISYGCGIWTISGMDDELDPPATGLYDIWLAENAPPDSSYNVHFNPAPKFGYGESRCQFAIDVINLAQPAQACLHFRDGAGNEYDTVLSYSPQLIDAVPSLLDVGAVRSLDTSGGVITLYNNSASSASFGGYRLKYGLSHGWRVVHPPETPSSPTAPFTIAAHDSVKFYFVYLSPNGAFEQDNDTLFVTTCREFPIAALHGRNLKPAIFAIAHDFGYRYINPQTPDTSSADIMVKNVGPDVLHVTNATLVNTSPVLPQLPEFSIVSTPPTPAVPWVIVPGDSAHITVLASPRTEGLRTAYISFENDANHQILDSAALQMVALVMPVAVKETSEIPNASTLAENYPNPFSDATTIAFDAPEGNYVVGIFNSIGEKVGEIGAARGGDGKYDVRWSASSMPAGLYYYVVRSLMMSGKFVVVK